jgi:hypothetical protein
VQKPRFWFEDDLLERAAQEEAFLSYYFSGLRQDRAFETRLRKRRCTECSRTGLVLEHDFFWCRARAKAFFVDDLDCRGTVSVFEAV